MFKNVCKRLPLSLLAALSVTACGDRAPSAQGQSFDQVAQAVARKDDRVTAEDLARWIIEGKKDFALIDVRSAEDFSTGHIEGARNLSVSELVMPETLKSLPKDRRLVIYSQGSEVAAQAAVLLRLAGGHDASLLLGGYNYWSEHVLNPDVQPVLADGEFPRVSEQHAIACHFVGGGQIAQASPVAAPAPAAAPVEAPVPAYTPPVKQQERQRNKPAASEGC
ncbi:rhodanese-like domain-containing protein [Sinimarinibacterium sp. CAU 1509]|uniref:rhodanese-like domain-containing protein n=1 Tax=Sinimarinibacterium sp. CAU 1509 TaxID=2562283 RepID=UPI0010ACE684|nr:rhodanese-like domain-containing protein [Sinimarinibacterium sp. CAU 1509]TJY63283.1 rhodanese-like domain-containing protein [Sinimarinibacterium sp. CAU 1509]